jgi:ubiquinone/menaquinone biosynthesis C-methylase UbiE
MSQQTYLPPMGKKWLLPLYDPFTRLSGVGRVHDQLLDRAGLERGQRVLEIGCGTGNVLTALGSRLLGIEAVGIDPDEGALRKARRKAARRHLKIKYELAYAGELPLQDESFDRVLSSLMLHHLGNEERTRALREVRRVLRPRGQLHVADLTHNPRGGRSHKHNSVPDQVLAALRESGLTDVAQDARGTGHFGGVVFYKATK